jgi:hypothetical protein
MDPEADAVRPPDEHAQVVVHAAAAAAAVQESHDGDERGGGPTAVFVVIATVNVVDVVVVVVVFVLRSPRSLLVDADKIRRCGCQKLRQIVTKNGVSGRSRCRQHGIVVVFVAAAAIDGRIGLFRFRDRGRGRPGSERRRRPGGRDGRGWRRRRRGPSRRVERTERRGPQLAPRRARRDDEGGDGPRLRRRRGQRRSSRQDAREVVRQVFAQGFRLRQKRGSRPGGGYPADLGGSEENGGGGASAKGGDVSAAVGVRLPTRRSQSGAVVRIYLLRAQKRYESQDSVMYKALFYQWACYAQVLQASFFLFQQVAKF